MKTIENDYIKVEVNECGAELYSIVRKSDGREFLWQGNPEYWKRRSPVLFPIVGAVWNNEMRVGASKYCLSQHGFARDALFTLVAHEPAEMWMSFSSCEDTLALYPFDFRLEIGYRLAGSTVEVMWRVKNPSTDEVLHFQIGAHPAFNYIDYDPEAQNQGYMRLAPAAADYVLSVIGEKGCLNRSDDTLHTGAGDIEITRNTFDADAIILENSQVQEVTLLARDKTPYLRVSFDAPLVGLWSPARGKYAPFVCIEPWYGRCDREHFTGQYADKEWMQHLAPGADFSASYKITLL